MTNFKSRFSFDFEFVECEAGVYPISLAVVENKTAAYFYAEFCDFPEHFANEFVRKNVFPKLIFHGKFPVNYEIQLVPSYEEITSDEKEWLEVRCPSWLEPLVSHADRENSFSYYGTTPEIVQQLEAWIELLNPNGSIADVAHETEYKPAFYGWYCSYDWVLFARLFGRMVDLPENYPYFPTDLKPIANIFQLNAIFKKRLPVNETGEHNALVDTFDINASLGICLTEIDPKFSEYL